MAIDDKAIIDSISTAKLGTPNNMPVEATPTPAPDPKAKDSNEDKASAKGSPQTEGDKMQAEAVVYEIDMGDGKKRNMTPKQISSTMQRYAALNYQNANLKPVNDLVAKILRANPNMQPKDVAGTLENILKSSKKNPEMGNTKGEQPAKAGEDNIGDALTKWSEDNAISLPPGYAEMMAGNTSGMNSMGDRMAKMENMLQQVLAMSRGNVNAAKDTMDNANNMQIQAMQKQIANNIDSVQQQLGLPDEAAQNFPVFMAERGYTMEDLIDPTLTMKLMQDYKNNLNSPEMERLVEIAKKRSAYTGSLGSTPSANATGDAPTESRFDQFANAKMAQKGMA